MIGMTITIVIGTTAMEINIGMAVPTGMAITMAAGSAIAAIAVGVIARAMVTAMIVATGAATMVTTSRGTGAMVATATVATVTVATATVATATLATTRASRMGLWWPVKICPAANLSTRIRGELTAAPTAAITADTATRGLTSSST